MNTSSISLNQSNKKVSETIFNQFKKVVGEKNVLSNEMDLVLYSYDSALDRAVPSAVILPESTTQISAVIKICHQNKIPFVARGAGTNLCGGTIPLHDSVVIAPTKMNQIISIDPQKRIAVVEPGLPNLFLKKALEPYGLFYAPDPASQKACTIGGNIGTNAGGPHCLKYGVTSHHIVALEVVLPDGEIAKFNIHEDGYDMTGFFVGSEGTLGIVTQATLNLIPIPKRVETMLVSFPSLTAAIQTVTDIVSEGIIPATLEAMDKVTIQAVESFIHAGYPTDAEAVLLIEVDGGDEVKQQVKEIQQICQKNQCKEFRLAKDEQEREKLWEGRRGSYPAMARLAPNVLVEDGAVPRNLLPEALKRVHAIADRDHLTVALIFHAGDGNLHPQILFDERDEEQTAKVKRAGHEMLKACVDLGGTISGEHGIGIDKRDAMRWLFTPQTLNLFRKVKQSLDPENLSNPDKLIPVAEEGSQKIETGGQKREEREQKSYYEPKSEEELCSILSSISKLKKKVLIKGAGTHLKKQISYEIAISTQSLNQIIEHDVENFTVTVQCGIKIDELQKALHLKNQKVFLESGGTAGGILAANPIQCPLIRDQVLGMKVALSDGSIVQFGAKVMKNVAGYDLTKLLLGSWGTLGVICSVILKTYPKNFQFNSNHFPSIVQDSISQNKEKIFQKIKSSFDPENTFFSLEDVIQSL